MTSALRNNYMNHKRPEVSHYSVIITPEKVKVPEKYRIVRKPVKT